MLNILRKELSTFFNSAIAYIVIGVFLLLSGLFFWFYPDSNILDFGFADMSGFFQFTPFVMMFLAPAVCMRMLTEEFRNGTLEFLYTKPISVFQIILGKFGAAFLIICLALIPTVCYYFSLYLLGNPVGNIDTASVIGSYIGLFFLVAVFCAIGIFASSITNNQVIAFILGAILCYLTFYGFNQVSQIFSGSLEYIINYIGLAFHYESLGKGILDSRDMIYMISISALFIILTKVVLQRKRN